MVDLRERCSARGWGMFTEWLDSPIGRAVELITPITLSIYAVTLYPDGAGTLVQALVQAGVVGGGLFLVGLGAFLVFVIYVAPRAMLTDARREIAASRAGSPVLTIDGPFCGYWRDVDSSRSTIWYVVVSNTTPGTVARSVTVSLRSVGRMEVGGGRFPATLHESVKTDYRESGTFVTTRDIRFGDEVMYEVMSEPYERCKGNVGELVWHTDDYATGGMWQLTGASASILEVELEGGRAPVVIRAVADPPCAVLDHECYLVLLTEAERSELSSFELTPVPTAIRQSTPNT